MDNDVTISVPKLYLVGEGGICGSCIAVPYNLEQKPTIEWLVVRNREEWDEIFVSDMEIRVEDGS
jgi:disulfide oxidoreductase YuzD